MVKTKLTAKGAVLSPEKRDLETYRNQVLQHSLAMKARGDVHANKCCYNLERPVGRYYFLR